MTYIAVEGPTGVGKTTLAECLAERLGWALLLDPYEDNPFIRRYYEAPPSPEWTPLLVESAFMFLRLAQLRHAAPRAGPGMVSDYAFFRTRLYARLLPDARDAERLVQMHASWAVDVPEPDVVVVLAARFETLRARIRRRAREIEEPLSDDHILDLQRLFADLRNDAPPGTVFVDTEDWDPRRAEDLDRLIRTVGL